MNEGKKNIILFGSVAANIFLVAFVLGRLSSPGMMPQPMMFPPPGQMGQQQMRPMPPDGNFMHGPPGAPGFGGGMGSGPGGGAGRDGQAGGFRGQLGAMPSPPPMFGPGDVFGQQDMQANLADLQKNFDKMQGLRQEFAAKLQQGQFGKEEIMKYFSDMNAAENELKTQMQQKVAERLSSMPEEERRQIAMRMQDKFGPPPGMGPGGMQPGMQGGMQPGMPPQMQQQMMPGNQPPMPPDMQQRMMMQQMQQQPGPPQ